MKKIIFLSLFLGLLFNVNAQDESTAEDSKGEKIQREFGFNSTFFVKQFLSFSNNNIGTSPYIFTYKRINEKNTALRMGLGMGVNVRNSPSSNGLHSNRINLDLRIGLEKRFLLSPKWLAYTGGDFLNSFSQLETSTIGGDNSVRDNEIGFGLAAVGGIQFFINKRLSLLTESSFQAKGSILMTHIDGENESTGTELDIDLLLPTTLYFVIHF